MNVFRRGLHHVGFGAQLRRYVAPPDRYQLRRQFCDARQRCRRSRYGHRLHQRRQGGAQHHFGAQSPGSSREPGPRVRRPRRNTCVQLFRCVARTKIKVADFGIDTASAVLNGVHGRGRPGGHCV